MPVIGGVNVPFVPAGGVNQLKKSPVNRNINGPSFNDFLNEEISKLKFSGHAKTRMNSRDIQISDAEMLRLDDAVLKAGQKNAVNPLILMDDKVFIVNIPNNTVITVMDKEQLNDNVITQIDSAVIA
jgi:flagellar operon protein